MRKRILAAVALLGVAAVFATGLNSGRGMASQAPVVQVVTRHRAIQLMEHGEWCSRLRPGAYECTPAMP
jgi:hypothetical protein